jgi:hypothetical protein
MSSSNNFSSIEMAIHCFKILAVDANGFQLSILSRYMSKVNEIYIIRYWLGGSLMYIDDQLDLYHMLKLVHYPSLIIYGQ